MVVTPGFINCHLHVSYAHAVRGIFPDDLGPAYLPDVFRLQGAMSEEDEYYTSLLAITELLKYGTTTFLDPGSTRYLDRCTEAYRLSGCRLITGTHVVDRPNPLNLPVSTTAEAIRTMELTILLETMRSMYLIAVLYKDGRQDWKMIPAETALEQATIGGADALGLGQDLGSIEVGKKADLVLFDTRRPEWGALFNPVNSLVYNADGRSVHTVIVDGRVAVESYQPLFVDEWELIRKVQALGEDLVARTGVTYPSRWPVI
jgi:cytosine/adenosine deaminase-related metal-dependent hydrolase